MNNKYTALNNTTDWIINSSSEEFMSTFNMLDGNYSGITIGEFIDLFVDDKKNNDIEYNIITTGNFIFGAEEITSDKDKEWKQITMSERTHIGSVELIDIKNIKVAGEDKKYTDLYYAANDSVYDYSLAA